MVVCTFFGHRAVPYNVESALRSVITDLIEQNGVKLFYVGNNGEFDAMVRRVLKDLCLQYPITYHVVLAYIPVKRLGVAAFDYSDTVLPDGIETVPKRFAIDYRNKWMTDRSDYVVTFVTGSISSGAAKFKMYAERKKKTVIELSEITKKDAR